MPAVNTAVGPSAAEHVFGVVELCEAILLFAEPADIVRCERVNRAIRTTIAHSRDIRKKLFRAVDQAVTEQVLNPLLPAFFSLQPGKYRKNTIPARIDVAELWSTAGVSVRPSWEKLLISQPPVTTCVIPTGTWTMQYVRRYYPSGMTFGDLDKALVAAHGLRKGLKTTPQRLKDLTDENNPVLLYLDTVVATVPSTTAVALGSLDT